KMDTKRVQCITRHSLGQKTFKTDRNFGQKMRKLGQQVRLEIRLFFHNYQFRSPTHEARRTTTRYKPATKMDTKRVQCITRHSLGQKTFKTDRNFGQKNVEARTTSTAGNSTFFHNYQFRSPTHEARRTTTRYKPATKMDTKRVQCITRHSLGQKTFKTDRNFGQKMRKLGQQVRLEIRLFFTTTNSGHLHMRLAHDDPIQKWTTKMEGCMHHHNSKDKRQNFGQKCEARTTSTAGNSTFFHNYQFRSPTHEARRTTTRYKPATKMDTKRVQCITRHSLGQKTFKTDRNFGQKMRKLGQQVRLEIRLFSQLPIPVTYT
ncbi:unnamed protein product, partial [Meganyctiphanes norvegica]